MVKRGHKIISGVCETTVVVDWSVLCCYLEGKMGCTMSEEVNEEE